MLLVALLAHSRSCIMKSPRIIISVPLFSTRLCRRILMGSVRVRLTAGPASALGTETLPRPNHQAGALKTHRKIVVKRIRSRSQGSDLGISRLEMNVQEQRKRDIQPPSSRIHPSKIVRAETGGREGVKWAAQSHRLPTETN